MDIESVVFGELAEWSIAAVLKTVEVRASGGSNPSLSAPKQLVAQQQAALAQGPPAASGKGSAAANPAHLTIGFLVEFGGSARPDTENLFKNG